MAKVKLNPSLVEMRGKIGNMVYRRTASGKIITTKCPDMSNVEWSPAQIAQRERLKQANAYARAAMADPRVRAIYEKTAKKKKRQPFRLAVSDYLKGKDLLARK
jgi:hypothetical protein